MTIRDGLIMEEEPAAEEVKLTTAKSVGKTHEYTIELLDDSFREEEYQIFIKYQASIQDLYRQMCCKMRLPLYSGDSKTNKSSMN